MGFGALALNSPCLFWSGVWKPQGSRAGCAAFLRRLLSCVLRVSEIEFAVIVVAVDRLIVCGICWKVQRPLHRPLADTFIYNFLGGWWMDRIQQPKLFRLVFHGMHLLSRTAQNMNTTKKKTMCWFTITATLHITKRWQVEAITHLPFIQVVKKNIFEPKRNGAWQLSASLDIASGLEYLSK
jgi:hypothetical protein